MSSRIATEPSTWTTTSEYVCARPALPPDFAHPELGSPYFYCQTAVGDVFLATGVGNSLYIFNILLPTTHPRNQNVTLPPGFAPFVPNRTTAPSSSCMKKSHSHPLPTPPYSITSRSGSESSLNSTSHTSNTSATLTLTLDQLIARRSLISGAVAFDLDAFWTSKINQYVDDNLPAWAEWLRKVHPDLANAPRGEIKLCVVLGYTRHPPFEEHVVATQCVVTRYSIVGH
ncbi:hypothetical protein AX16_007100 [Volvariella volvacea WC 439]|nr:hypothetical protein AX16_007100 [Volvariella volvacea WC 439]